MTKGKQWQNGRMEYWSNGEFRKETAMQFTVVKCKPQNARKTIMKGR